MEPQIAAQFLGTLIQSAMTFLAVDLAIIIFIVQDETLAPFFLNHRIVWICFALSCFLWVSVIGWCIVDFMNINLNVQFSSWEITRQVIGFLATLILSLLIFALILIDRKRLKKG